jgi:hypothetical protein
MHSFARPRPPRAEWTVEECARFAALKEFELLKLLSTDKKALATARRLGSFTSYSHQPPAQGAFGCAKAADRVAIPPTHGRTATRAAGNSQQRRSVARQKLHKERQAAARSATCRLRLRAILMREFRWQRMQAVWTEWMRQRTATAIPALENIEMTTDDNGARKRAGCLISTPVSPSATEETTGKKTRSGASPASPVSAAQAGAGPSHGATASPSRSLSTFAAVVKARRAAQYAAERAAQIEANPHLARSTRGVQTTRSPHAH